MKVLLHLGILMALSDRDLEQFKLDQLLKEYSQRPIPALEAQEPIQEIATEEPPALEPTNYDYQSAVSQMPIEELAAADAAEEAMQNAYALGELPETAAPKPTLKDMVQLDPKPEIFEAVENVASRNVSRPELEKVEKITPIGKRGVALETDLSDDLKIHEGYAGMLKEWNPGSSKKGKRNPGSSEYGTYWDHKGNLTTGIGALVTKDLKEYAKTKGYNLDTLSKDQALDIFQNYSLPKEKRKLDKLIKEKKLEKVKDYPIVYDQLLNMTFNMGADLKTNKGLASFKNSLKMLKEAVDNNDSKKMEKAVENFKKSKWYKKDVGIRGDEVLEKMKKGFEKNKKTNPINKGNFLSNLISELGMKSAIAADQIPEEYKKENPMIKDESTVPMRSEEEKENLLQALLTQENPPTQESVSEQEIGPVEAEAINDASRSESELAALGRRDPMSMPEDMRTEEELQAFDEGAEERRLAAMSPQERLLEDYKKQRKRTEARIAEAEAYDRRMKAFDALAQGIATMGTGGFAKVPTLGKYSGDEADNARKYYERLMKDFKRRGISGESDANWKITKYQTKDGEPVFANPATRQLVTSSGKTVTSDNIFNEKGERLAVSKANLDQRERKFEHTKKEKDELSDVQTKAITGLDSTDNMLDMIDEMKSTQNIKTSRGKELLESITPWIPGDFEDEDFAGLQALTGNNLFEYIKNTSGVQYSVQELAKMKANIPNVGDSDKVFNRKLKVLKDIIKTKKETLLEGYEKQGKDPSKFKGEGKSTSDKVMVKAPNGQMGRIPRKQLEEAVKRGYVLAE
jgi:hypothetical protein